MTKRTEKPDAVVCVHGTGINGLGIVRSLGRLNLNVYVIAIKGDFNLAAFSRYCSSLTEISRFDGDRLYHALMSIADNCDSKPVLFFDNDKMMNAVSGYAGEIEKKFRITSPLNDMQNLNSKKYQMDMARKAGIEVPMTWYPDTWEDLATEGTKVNTRFIAKPCQVVYPYHKPFKAVIGEDVNHLTTLLKAHVHSPRGIIVQEYIDGPDSDIHVAIGYKSFFTDFCQIITGAKIYQTRPGAGVMAVGRAKDDPDIRHMTQKLISILGYRGIIGVEYKFCRENGKFYFIEISPRTALYNTLGLKSGLNLPMLAYMDHVDRRELDGVRLRNNSAHFWIHVQSDLTCLLCFRRFRNIKQAIYPYLNPKQWAVFASDDLKPWIVSMKEFIRTYFNALMGRIKKATVNIFTGRHVRRFFKRWV